MTTETLESLLAPLRAAMEDLVRKAGHRTYGISWGHDDYMTLEVLPDGTVRDISNHWSPYRRDAKEVVVMPLSALEYSHLSQMAYTAAFEMAPPAEELARRAEAQARKDLYAARQQAILAPFFQGLLCPSGSTLAPIRKDSWPLLLTRDTWELAVELDWRRRNAAGCRDAYLDVEFEVGTAKVLRARLLVRATDQVLGSFTDPGAAA